MVAEVEAVVDILKVDSLEFGVDGEADDEEECTHERVRRVFETRGANYEAGQFLGFKPFLQFCTSSHSMLLSRSFP